MTTELQQALTSAESVLRQTCIDLADKPVYLLALSSYPELSHYADSIGAFSYALGATMWPKLESRGEWNGPGPAIFLNDCKMRPGRTRQQFQEYMAVIALHELAHFLDVAARRDHEHVDEHPAYVAATSSLSAMFAAQEQWNNTEPMELPKWHRHESRFIRACCHLSARLADTGIRDRFDLSYADDFYGCSPSHTYRFALRDELDLRFDEPIQSILASEPPAVFSKLWQRDTGQVIEQV